MRLIALLLILAAGIFPADFRRPIPPASPMWLIHVDHPIKADPQVVIDAIPEDIKPYAVLNLALTTDSGFNGDSLASAWLAVASKNDMWAMVQPSAGIRNSMPDSDTTAYDDLFRKFPNQIGFDFAEQSWGYTSEEFNGRIELFARLFKIANRYGGYLYVNDCMSVSNDGFNVMAQLRKNADFYAATETYAGNFIIGDKTTMGYGYYDNESMALGAILSGHAGHYAIRFDQYSWSWSGRGRVFGTEIQGKQEDFGSPAWFSCPEALMGISIVEHLLLTGATVMDGELAGNKTGLKKSGRYPSDSSKIDEFNALFPAESSGDMFIARKADKWLSYNPAINTDMRSQGRIPLKYNACKEVKPDYAAHTFGLMTESGGKLEFYPNNYRTDKNPLWDGYPTGFTRTTLLNTVLPGFIKNPLDSGFRKSVITVSGCSGQPAYTLTDLGNHPPSTATPAYANGEFQLTVNHNGPLSITLAAAGSETGRLPVPVASNLVRPAPPSGKFPAAEGVWLDAECGKVGSLWNTPQSATAAKGSCITIKNGNDGTAGAPAGPEGQIAFDLDSGSTEVVKAQVSNLAGRILFEKEIRAGKNLLDIHSLKTGTYLVRLEGANTDIVKKFVNVRSDN